GRLAQARPFPAGRQRPAHRHRTAAGTPRHRTLFGGPPPPHGLRRPSAEDPMRRGRRCRSRSRSRCRSRCRSRTRSRQPLPQSHPQSAAAAAVAAAAVAAAAADPLPQRIPQSRRAEVAHESEAKAVEISRILETMEYGPAPEADGPVREWLAGHSAGFGLVLTGQSRRPAGAATFTTANPATGETLATVVRARPRDIDAAVAAARAAFPAWSALPGHGRARFLYALARQVQK